MTVQRKVVLFVLSSIGIVWVSRASLRDVRAHGFYRFLAWETILVMFLMNVNDWFVDPFSIRQVVSWLFLVISLVLVCQGVRLFRTRGGVNQDRADPGLLGIEKTTELVTSGLYRHIRHPFYSSLLFLGWGILLKGVSWQSVLLAAVNTVLLVITGKREEIENIQYFGAEYREYMKRTKMFIPFIF
jgi:protein-S-isoprenylcysteine O-methyltransferase Ste14